MSKAPAAGRSGRGSAVTRRATSDFPVVTNTALIRRRGRQAGFLSLGGLLILGVGLVLNFRGAPAPAMAALLAGSLCSWVGVGLAEKWLKPPRADTAIQRGLKGVGRAFGLYHWLLPADHVLIAPWGLTVLVPLTVDSQVTVSEGRWREHRPLFRRLLTLGRRPLGNPRAIAKLETDALRELVAAKAPQLVDVPIDALAVFTQPAVVVSGTDPALPSIRADELRDWATNRRKTEALTNAQKRELEKMLDAVVAQALTLAEGGRGSGRAPK